MFFNFFQKFIDYQYENDSEISSASFASSDHEDITGIQSYQTVNDQALYEESRRVVEELDARIADLSSGNTTIIQDEQKHGKVNFLKSHFFIL